MNQALIEAGQKAQAGSKAAYDFYAKFDKAGDANAPKMTTADVEEFNRLHKIAEDDNVEYQKLLGADNAAKALKATMDAMPKDASPSFMAALMSDKPKSVGELFVESDWYKSLATRGFQPGQMTLKGSPNAELKTTFSRTAGWAPESLRTGQVILSAQKPLELFDAIPTGRTAQAVVKYMRETTFTNNAAARAEAAATTDSAFALTEISHEVEMVAGSVPVTLEQLQDVEGIQDYLNQRLGFQVMSKLENELINGTGTTPSLDGVLGISGIQTQALGSDNRMDCGHKAMTLVSDSPGYAKPSAFFYNPTDWQSIRLVTTADGIYLFGPPNMEGPLSLWGLPVVKTSVLSAGTAVVGDWVNFSRLVYKTDVMVEMTNSHGTNFNSFIYNIRAGIRAAAAWYRDAAFCKMTGL